MLGCRHQRLWLRLCQLLLGTDKRTRLILLARSFSIWLRSRWGSYSLVDGGWTGRTILEAVSCISQLNSSFRADRDQVLQVSKTALQGERHVVHLASCGLGAQLLHSHLCLEKLATWWVLRVIRCQVAANRVNVMVALAEQHLRLISKWNLKQLVAQ